MSLLEEPEDRHSSSSDSTDLPQVLMVALTVAYVTEARILAEIARGRRNTAVAGVRPAQREAAPSYGRPDDAEHEQSFYVRRAQELSGIALSLRA